MVSLGKIKTVFLNIALSLFLVPDKSHALSMHINMHIVKSRSRGQAFLIVNWQR